MADDGAEFSRMNQQMVYQIGKSIRLDITDLRPGVTGVVFWYVQSVNSGTDI